MRPVVGPVLKAARSSWVARAAESAVPEAESSLQAQLRTRDHSPVSLNPDARLRFAPSPTGRLHLGGLRTALINRMMARKWGGKWLLRIEDTDRTRYQEGAVDGLREDLEWAGLEYDEGVGVGGSYGPYTQSERRDLYHEHAKILLDQGKAYECFCTKDDSQEPLRLRNTSGPKNTFGMKARTPTEDEGAFSLYDGRCRHLTEEERARRKRAGEKYSIRFKSPGPLETLPDDLVFGALIPQLYAGVDDFVLIKQDSWPTYHLASVVDDHHMRISHVVRGEEWIASMSKHIHLYNAFGWIPPQFAHLALLVNPDGSKLSKRNNSVTVENYRELGYEPEALLNFLGLIGWTSSIVEPTTPLPIRHKPQEPKLAARDWTVAPTMEQMELALGRSSSFIKTGGLVLGLDDLSRIFDLDKLNKRKGVVDMSRLLWINKATMRRHAWLLEEQKEAVQRSLMGDELDAQEINADRRKTIERFRNLMREKHPHLDNEPLLADEKYVWDVLVLEIPRVEFFHELEASAYFFQEPDWSAPEVRGWLSKIGRDSYVQTLDLAIGKFQEYLPELAPDVVMDEQEIRPLIEMMFTEGKTKLGLWKGKNGLMQPLRLALTAQHKGPTVAELVSVLGRERTLARLEKAREWGLGAELPQTAWERAREYHEQIGEPQRKAEEESFAQKIEDKLRRRAMWERLEREKAAKGGTQDGA